MKSYLQFERRRVVITQCIDGKMIAGEPRIVSSTEQLSNIYEELLV